MNFRQRVAWLLLLCYLTCSCAVLYYVFELHSWYSFYTVERVDTRHSDTRHSDNRHSDTRHSDVTPAWHFVGVPSKVWIGALVTAYLQVFFLLLVCTRAAPKCSLALFWPLYLYLQCRSCCVTMAGPSPKSLTIPVGHGHRVINT